MNEIEILLAGYEADVDIPDVSGMEHVQMLITRSKLYELEGNLTTAQKQRLLVADQKLVKQVERFYSAIQQITDLSRWRDQQSITTDHWWWYLDVLAKMPEQTLVH